MIKTGTTNQFQIVSQETIEGTTYAPGVYHSWNSEDALPAQREFYIRCEEPVFCANDLNEALTMWADNGRPVVKAVSSVG